MNVHALILEKPDSEIAKRIAEVYPEHYSFGETCFFIHTTDSSLEVTEKIDIKSYADASKSGGVAVNLGGSSSGMARQDFWEWFSTQAEQDRMLRIDQGRAVNG